jgi:hypothetical protein
VTLRIAVEKTEAITFRNSVSIARQAKLSLPLAAIRWVIPVGRDWSKNVPGVIGKVSLTGVVRCPLNLEYNRVANHEAHGDMIVDDERIAAHRRLGVSSQVGKAARRAW